MVTTTPEGRPVELTAAQITRAYELAPVLRAADAGEAWQEPDGRSVLTCSQFFGVSDPIADVTEEMACAERTGLAAVRPLDAQPGGRWELTAEGRDALAWLADRRFISEGK